MRFGSLFLISFLVDVWQVQAIGAIYLLYISIHHILKSHVFKKKETDTNMKQSGFWATVVKVELADIAFAVDSILAAVALAVTLPKTSLPQIGGLDGGQFIVILLGGIIGLVIMRFAATVFVKLLKTRPSLETAKICHCRMGGCEAHALYTVTSSYWGRIVSFYPFSIMESHFLDSASRNCSIWLVFIKSIKKRRAGKRGETRGTPGRVGFLKEISFHFHNTYITNKGRYPLFLCF